MDKISGLKTKWRTRTRSRAKLLFFHLSSNLICQNWNLTLWLFFLNHHGHQVWGPIWRTRKRARTRLSAYPQTFFFILVLSARDILFYMTYILLEIPVSNLYDLHIFKKLPRDILVSNLHDLHIFENLLELSLLAIYMTYKGGSSSAKARRAFAENFKD